MNTVTLLGNAVLVTKPDRETSTVTGTAVDIRQYFGKLELFQAVGTVSGTSPTLDGKIQDSADGSTGWGDVSGATFTQVTASDDEQSITISADSSKGYIRYVGTIAGTSPSFDLAVVGFGQQKISAAQV
ncbi:MAG: hypothetical protein ACO3LT_10805 [Ilumatobacteraceae bacterium]